MHHVQYRVENADQWIERLAPLGYRPICVQAVVRGYHLRVPRAQRRPADRRVSRDAAWGPGHEAARMSLQQLSDRFEIRALIVRYSNALDARRFEWLDEVFTADAYIDYRATGGIDGRYPKIRIGLPPAVSAFPHVPPGGNIGVTSSMGIAPRRAPCA
jgi:hypothetical protein